MSSHDRRPELLQPLHLGLLPPSRVSPHTAVLDIAECGEKSSANTADQFAPKEPLIFGRCTPTIFVPVENYIRAGRAKGNEALGTGGREKEMEQERERESERSPGGGPWHT